MDENESKYIEDIIGSDDPIASYRNLPEELKTESLSFGVVDKYPEIIKYIPEKIISDRMVYTALSHDPVLVNSIPKSVLTENVCISLIKDGWGIVLALPDSSRTKAVWEAAVENYSSLLGYSISFINEIPYPEIAKKMCEKVLEEYPHSDINLMNEVKEEFLPDSLIDKLHNITPEKFPSLPDEFKTPERCCLALKHDTENFQYIPKDKLTHQVCATAIKLDLDLIAQIPPKFKTEKLWKVLAHVVGEFLEEYIDVLERFFL